ncbi:WD repeat-containing protein 44-like [Daphnia carinata]|uniref:WD repeat-containing protein 44-like n=1 Tax=Daphnia carinata TaxID=120202 RepID=UPI0028695F40|nr:WD repeat-containing protein 44-like [Daphnia carinata]
MSSDSEEFYDLDEQDVTIVAGNKSAMEVTTFFFPNVTSGSHTEDGQPSSLNSVQQVYPTLDFPKEKETEAVPNTKPIQRPAVLEGLDSPSVSGAIEKRRKKLEELRKRMLTDDDEGNANTSPPGSHPSSVEGLYAVSKPSHPFKFIDHETMSMQSTVSLGRVGRVLGGEIKLVSRSGSRENMSRATTPEVKTPSSMVETPKTPLPVVVSCHEPDVVASAKASIQTDVPLFTVLANPVDETTQPHFEPVAPPRRRRNKTQAPTPPAAISLTPPTLQEPIPSGMPKIPVAIPVSTSAPLLTSSVPPTIVLEPSKKAPLHSFNKGLEFSLDLKSATKGSYVIKPQDEECTRGERRNSLTDTASRTPERSLTCDGDVKIDKVSCDPNCEEEASGIQTLNMFVRTRTDSGKPLSDMEILEQVTVLNLDTGEQIPLSIAEDKLPQCLNPLSLHIMRLTSEYISNSSLEKDKESDNESVDSKKTYNIQSDNVSDGDSVSLRKKTSQLKKFLGSKVRRTVGKARMIAQEVSLPGRQKEEMIDIPDELTGGEQHVKMKASSSHKGPYEFDTLQCVQEMHGEHLGPIWCMKFSPCGRLLATAGQDRILRIWVLKTAFNHFQDMRSRCNADSKSSPTPSQESLVSQHSVDDPVATIIAEKESDPRSPFVERPFCTYSAHTSDLLDVSWSKNYFILSSSMDKTVRLWHISRKECLCCFQHIDFVTAIAFHPRDDRYFLSGSLDGKLRLWNIPDKKVALWNELDGQHKLITAANFCQNGKFAVVGSYDGRCVFYTTEHLKYYTQIHVRSTRGRNSKGRKITGIESLPNEDKILVTSNDSRIRLYDLRDLNLSCKYKGYVNNSSQIRACFSHDGKYIISGSENQYIYMWKTHHDYAKFSSARRDRNDYWEAIKAHNAVVTSAVFAPDSHSLIEQMERHRREKEEEKASSLSTDASAGKRLAASATADITRQKPNVEGGASSGNGYVLVSADFNGCIKVFVNRVKPKHSSLPVSALS